MRRQTVGDGDGKGVMVMGQAQGVREQSTAWRLPFCSYSAVASAAPAAEPTAERSVGDTVRWRRGAREGGTADRREGRSGRRR